MEIGSEYWLENITYERKDTKYNNVKLLMSGRTAIDYVLTVIQKQHKIQKAYLPSYCCESIIKPFIDKNIEVEFYSVSFNNGNFVYDINDNVKCDIFFAMNYFGFSCCSMDSYIERYKERNVCVIEDSTHSLLSRRKYNDKSDFVIASLRKWFPIISGGIVINQSNEFTNTEIQLNQNATYIKLKENAMTEKAEYMKNKDERIKKTYLEGFSKANEILNENYKNFGIDEKSYNILQNLNIEEIKRKRRNNVAVIYDFFKRQKKIKYLEKLDLNEDCPLFVPIFLSNEKRNLLSKFLIDNEVYCPNHWKIPKQIENNREQEIYKMELSLICDQRYEEDEIERYINLIMQEEL